MDIFTRFKTAVKIREVHLDNNIFQLHYRVTALFLLICAALVASRQHFGDPIDCIVDQGVPSKLLDTYCWIHSTYTTPNACNLTVGSEISHPCIDNSRQRRGPEERVYHTYYQWVYFVLFFQAACFYAPHFFWKSCESKLLGKLCAKLRDPLCKKKETFEQADSVVKYFERHWTSDKSTMHREYFHYFTLFEVVNLLNVILQVYIVDIFLGGTFTTYGLEVLNYSALDQFERVDPMIRVFPRMTKCTFNTFGPSGDVVRYDSLCILPLNIINEKIYIFMWFWFVFLAFVSVLGLIYRLMTHTRPSFRLKLLKRRAPYASALKLDYILSMTDEGDWFLLYMVCKNIDSHWFGFIIKHLSARLERIVAEKEAERRRSARHNKLSRNGNNNQNNRLRRHPRDDVKDMILKDDDDITDSEEEQDDDVGQNLDRKQSRNSNSRIPADRQHTLNQPIAADATQLETVVHNP